MAGITISGFAVARRNFVMKCLRIGKFSFAYLFILLTGCDAGFDGGIDEDLFFRFAAGNKGERGCAQKGKLKCVYSFHSLRPCS
jgi:hypothetical protein